MKYLTKEQQYRAFNNLMDSTISKTPTTDIESPSTEEYKSQRALIDEKIQQGVAEYAEAYIASSEFFIN